MARVTRFHQYEYGPMELRPLLRSLQPGELVIGWATGWRVPRSLALTVYVFCMSAMSVPGLGTILGMLMGAAVYRRWARLTILTDRRLILLDPKLRKDTTHSVVYEAPLHQLTVLPTIGKLSYRIVELSNKPRSFTISLDPPKTDPQKRLRSALGLMIDRPYPQGASHKVEG